MGLRDCRLVQQIAILIDLGREFLQCEDSLPKSGYVCQVCFVVEAEEFRIIFEAKIG